MSDNYDGPQMAAKILRQQKEIERLRKLIDIAAETGDIYERRLGEYETEIDRLRSALDRTLMNFDNLLRCAPVRDATETIEEARAALAMRASEGKTE